MIVLKILAVYLLIGLIMEAIFNGKKTVEDLASGEHSYIDTFFGTIIMAFISPACFVYGIFIGIRDEINSHREGA